MISLVCASREECTSSSTSAQASELETIGTTVAMKRTSFGRRVAETMLLIVATMALTIAVAAIATMLKSC